jgi:hypothetical protein
MMIDCDPAPTVTVPQPGGFTAPLRVTLSGSLSASLAKLATGMFVAWPAATTNAVCVKVGRVLVIPMVTSRSAEFPK